MLIKVTGYAAKHSFNVLKPFEFVREEPKVNEVEIEVLYCGVCHSDIHQVKNEWGTGIPNACRVTR
jgi:alcohol dehydrogenase (NADP+)